MKLSIILIIFSMVVTITVIQAISEGPEEVENWFKKLSYKKESVTKLHFFFHDNASNSKNQTAVKVAQSNNTFHSHTLFGLIMMIDDPLTTGPEPTSKMVGRAQGFYAFSDQQEIGLLMTMNMVFTDGKYNGSTLSILGRNPVLHDHREMPIIGGSGVFRLARGVATAKTRWFNGLDAIVEYNVMVVHY